MILSLGIGLGITTVRRALISALTHVLFIPSGSDRLIASDGKIFKVKEE